MFSLILTVIRRRDHIIAEYKTMMKGGYDAERCKAGIKWAKENMPTCCP